jgi:hypothetical protein
MHGEYVFGVEFHLEPASEASVRPRAFETTMRWHAPTPGEDGWLFFRNALWRGEVGDHEHVRSLAANALDVPVDGVDFRSLRADQEYVDALRDAVADDLSPFNADSVDDALSKYLGSSIDVVDDPGA